MNEHECFDADSLMCCVDGRLYGQCDYPGCSGCCESVGLCECDCHDKETNS